MLKLNCKHGNYYYSILSHPIARVMKFECFSSYFLGLNEGGCVVDYGAGDKPLEPFLRTKFKDYISADYPPSNKAHSKRPDIEIGEDGTLDFASSSADCVIMTEVLEHIYEPRKALNEVHRVLKGNGSLIGTVPFSIGEHEQPYDYYRYTSFCLRRLFEECGFEVVKIDYVGDGIGVAVSDMSKALNIITKGLYKLRLNILAKMVGFIIAIPGMLYYTFVKFGIDPSRIGYYKNNPLGFCFHVVKR